MDTRPAGLSSLHTIASIPFQLAAVSSSATDSKDMKAVTYLLEEIQIHGMAEKLTDRLTSKIGAKMDEVAQS